TGNVFDGVLEVQKGAEFDSGSDYQRAEGKTVECNLAGTPHSPPTFNQHAESGDYGVPSSPALGDVLPAYLHTCFIS
ncbi:MAG: hypothetical protein LBI05_08480, partial [Planctomycetaceae bacterium]|nr:hypothetical protein [Planctomycetaceae bacterium]